MQKKIKKIAILFAFFCLPKLFANSIAVQIFQKNGGNNEICFTSRVLEQGILDCFFENGFIVSNSPIFASGGEKIDAIEAKKSMSDAEDGSFNFFAKIVVFLDEKSAQNSETVLLSQVKKVQWKVFSSQNHSEIFSGEKIPQKNALEKSEKSGKDNAKSVEQFAKEIALEIKSKLNASARMAVK